MIIFAKKIENMGKDKKKKDKKKDSESIGLWLDHVMAHFIELKKNKVIIQSVYSPLETHVRYIGETGTGTKLGKTRSTNSEHHKHHREQNQLHEYYKTLGSRLKEYDKIYLFGPTTAKDELLNWIRKNEKVDGKTFIVNSASEMSVNQMVARVREVLGD